MLSRCPQCDAERDGAEASWQSGSPHDLLLPRRGCRANVPSDVDSAGQLPETGHRAGGRRAAPGRGAKRLPGFPIVWFVRNWSRDRRKLVVESAAFGIGYTAVLIWSGTGSGGQLQRRGGEPVLARDPRPADRHDRRARVRGSPLSVSSSANTCSSSAAAVRLLGPRPGPPASTWCRRWPRRAAFLGTGVVIYLSLNAVTHPFTLRLQLTHLWPWPSEGTVRVIALFVCLVAVAVTRYLRATAGPPGQASAVRESTDAAA